MILIFFRKKTQPREIYQSLVSKTFETYTFLFQNFRNLHISISKTCENHQKSDKKTSVFPKIHVPWGLASFDRTSVKTVFSCASITIDTIDSKPMLGKPQVLSLSSQEHPAAAKKLAKPSVCTIFKQINSWGGECRRVPP